MRRLFGLGFALVARAFRTRYFHDSQHPCRSDDREVLHPSRTDQDCSTFPKGFGCEHPGDDGGIGPARPLGMTESWLLSMARGGGLRQMVQSPDLPTMQDILVAVPWQVLTRIAIIISLIIQPEFRVHLDWNRIAWFPRETETCFRDSVECLQPSVDRRQTPSGRH